MKVMMIKFWLLVFFINIHCCIYAQWISTGEKLPLNLISNMGLEIKNKKLIILDFWGHSCSSCIESIPKLNRLQEKFKDSVEIIFVSKESKEATEKMFKDRPWLEVPMVRMIHGDTSLFKSFNIKGLPYLVWINQDTLVQYITTGEALNDENLKKYLSNNEIDYHNSIEIKRKQSLFEQEYNDNLLAYSYIALASPDTRIGNGINNKNIAQGIFINNSSIRELFVIAYGEVFNRSFNREWKVVSEIKNYDERFEKSRFFYELRVPQGMETEKYKRMINDLEYFFNLESYIDTVLMPSMVLNGDINAINKLKTKGGKSLDTFRKNSKFISDKSIILGSERVLKNIPYSVFSYRLKGLIEYNEEMPMVDLINYDGNIDVNFTGLSFDFYTFEELKQNLLKYNMYLTIEDMPIEVIRIRSGI